jgi:CPA2 family monovalent cation:H+ antiporter-2
VLEEISAEVSLGPWDEHLSTVVVNANSEAVEKNLAELDVRNRFGINIIMLKRGNRQIVAPSGDTRLLPGDSVLILGTDNEVALFDQFVSGSESISTSEDPIFELTSVKVEKGSKWENKSISSLNLPSLIRAVIVGVERGGERVLSPQADFILKAKDFVWLVLDKSKLGELKKLV